MAVKEGFCWPAFLFSLIWAMFHQLWFFAFFLMGLFFVTFFSLHQLGADPNYMLMVGFSIFILVGYLANDFRRRQLKKAGYLEQEVILSSTLEAATQRYLDTLIIRR